MLARLFSRTPLAAILAAPALLGAGALAMSGTALAGPCTGPGAPTTTETKCLTAVQIPGNPLIFVKSCKVSRRIDVAGYCQNRAARRNPREG